MIQKSKYSVKCLNIPDCPIKANCQYKTNHWKAIPVMLNINNTYKFVITQYMDARVKALSEPLDASLTVTYITY